MWREGRAGIGLNVAVTKSNYELAVVPVRAFSRAA